MKKKILLLSMPNYTVGFYAGIRTPSLGLVSLAGNVNEQFVEDIHVADLLMVQHNLRRYLTRILKKYSPDIVGLSCMSFQYETAIEIAKIVKKWNPPTIVIFGGYHPTIAYEAIADSEAGQYIDFMIRGEGEAAFAELVQALATASPIDSIQNLSFKRNGVFRHNSRSEILDLQSIKLPKRQSRITKKYMIFGKKADVVETSRGCTMQCDFCCMPQMYGRTFRKYPVERVVEDIQNAAHLGAEAIFFIDDNIFVNPKHLETICEHILHNGLQHIHYTIQASVAGISHDPKLIELMAQAGFKVVFLGIENIKKTNVEFLSKDTRVLEQTTKALSLLRRNRIISVGGFIFGNPGDDMQSLWDHVRFAQENTLDVPLFMLLTPFLKTRIREKILHEGLLTNPNDYSFYDLSHANLRTKFLSPFELNLLKTKMYAAYNNVTLMKSNMIKTHYPWFFVKLILSEVPRTAINFLRKLVFEDWVYRNYKAGKLREIRRMKRWLLDKKNIIQKEVVDCDIELKKLITN